MNHADRVQAGPDLEWRLEREVALLDIDHPNGFAVRLHNLGDFYSLQYVALWRRLLARHSALHVWGYTAHWNDPIAAALASLVRLGSLRHALLQCAIGDALDDFGRAPLSGPARRDPLPRTDRPDGKLFNVRLVLAIGAPHCVPPTLKFSRLPKWSRNALTLRCGRYPVQVGVTSRLRSGGRIRE